MANQLDTSEQLHSYLRRVSLRDDDVLSELRAETAELPMGTAMQVSAEEGQFLGLLVKLIGARTVLEVGTFTGYSALCMARSMPADGRLITCDVTMRWPAFGIPYWERAGVADRIDLRIGDATSTLDTMLADGEEGSVDLAFIDADKAGYDAYYERCLRLTRSGGLVAIDNTLFFGRVLDPGATDADTVAIRALNEKLRDDDRVDLTLLPLADGLTLARRR
jgi:O-methyltransferase